MVSRCCFHRCEYGNSFSYDEYNIHCYGNNRILLQHCCSDRYRKSIADSNSRSEHYRVCRSDCTCEYFCFTIRQPNLYLGQL